MYKPTQITNRGNAYTLYQGTLYILLFELIVARASCFPGDFLRISPVRVYGFGAFRQISKRFLAAILIWTKIRQYNC